MAGAKPRWNAETQRWESGGAPLAYVPPPPPLPLFAPYDQGQGQKQAHSQAGVREEGLGQTGAEQTGFVQTGPVDPYGRFLGQGSRRMPLVVIAVAAVLGAGAVAVWTALGRDGAEDGSAARPGATVSESAYPSDSSDSLDSSASSTDAGTDTPTDGSGATDVTDDPSTGVLPPGFRVAEDPKGFTIAVPEGWERSSRSNGVFYTTSDESSLIQVFAISEENMTSLDLVQQSSADLAARNKGYTEVAVGTVVGGDENPAGDAAELVYSYDSDKAGGRRQVIERVFTATDGGQYAVLVAAPAGEVADLRQLLGTVLEPFEPGWS
ncbi:MULTISPECIES: hypothetical protein [unclassified Streptomyces]|uniref:hypothetical protein n=1 Tax=unclassified Streptomyces TaxID=2593676 RepID=UPI00081F7293|nr:MULTISPECIES: hypothetical protein [unclassified Streptomyces]MYZ38884.1 hypothetical protein [Streptomyces sp. SID4917]SCG00907.1 hypothetical protein GA0115259_107123 [Streptomyces sp. MnatMP-M17]